MSADIISGKDIAQTIRREIAQKILGLDSARPPGLAVVLVGQNPASMSYVRAKRRACEECGMYSEDIDMTADTSEAELLAHIRRLNADTGIHGILVQLPLPAHIQEERVLSAISPEKDVDGFHAVNVGRLMLGQEGFVPCTPAGIVEMLHRAGARPEGKHCVIVGRSNIVGKPLANLLMQKSERGNGTVTLCHSRTPNIAEHSRQADILIAAIGRAEFIRADMVKAGAVVIDVGINRVADSSKKSGYRLVGDVAFAEVSERASKITPVPGGVGPMTIAMLLANTLTSAERHFAGISAEAQTAPAGRAANSADPNTSAKK